MTATGAFIYRFLHHQFYLRIRTEPVSSWKLLEFTKTESNRREINRDYLEEDPIFPNVFDEAGFEYFELQGSEQ